MTRIVLFILVTTQICNQVLSQTTSDKNDRGAEDLNLFQEFRKNFNIRFASVSDLNHRLAVFKENLKTILEFKKQPNPGYTLDINQFADITFKEFSSKYLGKSARTSWWESFKNLFKPKNNTNKLYVVPANRKNEKKDWRLTPNAIGPVRQQGSCGSCWCFASVDLVEQSNVILKGSPYVSLSQQELLECSKEQGSSGCQGGWETGSLTYIKNNGINKAEDYPYTGKEGSCKPHAKPGVNKIGGFTTAPSGPEGAIEALKTRTITVAFHVTNEFQFLRSGRYYPTGCPNIANHVTTAVAYDLSGEIPTITIKNSWGTSWGNQGYMEIALTQGSGICGITAQGNVNYISSMP